MTTAADEYGPGADRCAYPSCRSRTDGSLLCEQHKPGGYVVGTPHPTAAYVDGRYIERKPAPVQRAAREGDA